MPTTSSSLPTTSTLSADPFEDSGKEKNKATMCRLYRKSQEISPTYVDKIKGMENLERKQRKVQVRTSRSVEELNKNREEDKITNRFSVNQNLLTPHQFIRETKNMPVPLEKDNEELVILNPMHPRNKTKIRREHMLQHKITLTDLLNEAKKSQPEIDSRDNLKISITESAILSKKKRRHTQENISFVDPEKEIRAPKSSSIKVSQLQPFINSVRDSQNPSLTASFIKLKQKTTGDSKEILSAKKDVRKFYQLLHELDEKYELKRKSDLVPILTEEGELKWAKTSLIRITKNKLAIAAIEKLFSAIQILLENNYQTFDHGHTKELRLTALLEMLNQNESTYAQILKIRPLNRNTSI